MSKRHWEAVYRKASTSELGWYQAAPVVSLRLIRDFGVSQAQRVIDVGGGASLLVDRLLELGFVDLTVLDISEAALRESQQRLGPLAAKVSWTPGDIRQFRPETKFDLWHDRAVLHFFTRRRDRESYRNTLQLALKPGGLAIIGTFALSGRRRCAGLWVRRYGEGEIRKLLGPELHLVETVSETHTTPNGIEQPYTYFVLRYEKAA